MRSSLGYGAIALMLCGSMGHWPPPNRTRPRSPDQATPPGQATAPMHTVPPTGAAQPQNPLADQAKPAAVGPAQAATASSIPGEQIPGATRQTMPSTVSAENPAQDKLPIAAFQLPLSPEQKAKIAASIAQAPVTSADVSGLKVSSELPSNAAMQDFPLTLTTQMPEAKRYKYVNLPDQVLIVDPPNWKVVGVIPKKYNKIDWNEEAHRRRETHPATMFFVPVSRCCDSCAAAAASTAPGCRR